MITRTVGTRAEAEEFLNGNCAAWPDLSNGQRVVKLAPSGTVYKRGSFTSQEYGNYLRIKDIPIPGWYVPATEVYIFGDTCIIAMEYIEGLTVHENNGYDSSSWNCDCSNFFDEADMVNAKWELLDMHCGNAVVIDDGFAIIDMEM